MRSCAVLAPLMIWSRTGTVGGTKLASLMKKFVPFWSLGKGHQLSLLLS